MSGRASIDGRPIDFADGETVLSGARRLGVSLPTLCHVEGIAPEGGCRLCLVEVAGATRPLAACHTQLADGMQVRSSTPRLDTLRREVLDLWLSSLPEAALDDVVAGELVTLLAASGLEHSSYERVRADPQPTSASTDDHPYLRFDSDRCILCRRCLRVCEDVQGQFVYAIEGRGDASRLVFGRERRFSETQCTACGRCVDECPTGALWDCDGPTGEGSERTARSVCGFCGVGCAIDVEAAGERVLRIRGAADSPVNRGHLCAKGRFAHGYQRSPDRLRQPRLREGTGWRELSWEEATGWLAGRLRELRGRHGPEALGALTSSRSTNEAAYLLQKLFRTAIGTNNVDCCARVCHSSTALALQNVTGTGAASASYADIERARCIVVAGANPTEAHPVLGARIAQAARRGATLIVIDPRCIELAELAGHHLPLRAGTNVALLNALAKVLIEEALFDRPYVESRTEGFEELEAWMKSLSLDAAAATCGIEPSAIREAARALGRAGPALFVHGLGLSELTQGTASVMALCNLGMLSGSIGRSGAGMLPLRGQNNVQGNADMGAMPNLVTGYQRLDAAEVRARLDELWAAAPPAEPGLTIPEMLAAARDGAIRGLWIQGEDVAQSDPNESAVLAALESLELLVVQEIFPSETSRFAHLVLPAAGALEQDGTFTNGERRIQRVRAAVPAPGAARPDWQVVRDVANALGCQWSYAGPGEVMAEIARVAPDLFGGIDYERLEPHGLQWPCPSASHPGTSTVHAEGFLRGRGRLVSLDHVSSPEDGVPGFPYLLMTGRVLQHYNVGTMTRRTPNLALAAEDRLEMHPRDAEREGLEDGVRARVESRWGASEVRVEVSRRVTPGSVFLSFHFPETHANRLTSPYLDAQSKCPEYKVTAVRVSPV